MIRITTDPIYFCKQLEFSSMVVKGTKAKILAWQPQAIVSIYIYLAEIEGVYLILPATSVSIGS